MKYVSINNQKYNLSDFAKQYDLSYITVRRYFNKGYRNRLLLEKCRESSVKSFSIGTQQFKSKNEAAKKLGIKKSTFYRAIKNGELDKILNLQKMKRKVVIDGQ